VVEKAAGFLVSLEKVDRCLLSEMVARDLRRGIVRITHNPRFCRPHHVALLLPFSDCGFKFDFVEVWHVEGFEDLTIETSVAKPYAYRVSVMLM
jgi:hypothetical protein